jgi:hypothetical protein
LNDELKENKWKRWLKEKEKSNNMFFETIQICLMLGTERIVVLREKNGEKCRDADGWSFALPAPLCPLPSRLTPALLLQLWVKYPVGMF